MLIVKTGMDCERDVVQSMLRGHNTLPNEVRVLCGRMTFSDLCDTGLPDGVEGILSVGTCGGLSPFRSPIVGQCYVASTLSTPTGSFMPDLDWTRRLATVRGVTRLHWWSSGQFNTADTVADRMKLYQDTGAAMIDDESYAVARYATLKGIPFAILRSCSDVCTPSDDVPPAARNALQEDGGLDIFEVIKSVLSQRGQLPALEHLWKNLHVALAGLRLALDQIGPGLAFK